MAGRKYLLMLLMLGLIKFAYAQEISYQEADSTSYALYLKHDWKQLIIFGKDATVAGNDFPMLHLRIGYAYFNLGNYAAAIVQYEKVLAEDSQNQLAREYLYHCNQYLNQDEAAAYQASYLDTGNLRRLYIAPFGLVEGIAESSVKLNDIYYRGTAYYNRFGLTNRLGWRLQLEQSIAYFKQTINYRKFDLSDRLEINNSVHEFEYYGKLNYVITGKWQLLGGYHYLNTDYRQQTYHNHIGILGLKYLSKYVDLQTDVDLGDITDRKLQQYNAQVSFMPLGNLNLYLVSHMALLHQNSSSSFIFSQVVGTKVISKVWLDANVTFGRLNNYAESDGLYIYNAIDVTKFKAGSTGYFSVGKHALLMINYTYERKDDFYRNTSNYNQYSITGGVKWRF